MWALDGERHGDFGLRDASKVISARTVKHVGSASRDVEPVSFLRVSDRSKERGASAPHRD